MVSDSYTLSEYYLWRKYGEKLYPWDRINLNYDFLKHERKRIQEITEWRKAYSTTDNGKELPRVSFYTVPVELPTKLKAAISKMGNFNYIGLSALYNNPQAQMIALLPSDKNVPDEYRLIEISKSRKSAIFKPKSAYPTPSLIIEDYEYLRSDIIYVDIPHERMAIRKILNETLFEDTLTATSIQTPIISAPYVSGALGGITLSSFSTDTAFSRELVKTILLMVPPEYRTIAPPKSAFHGHAFDDFDGIKYSFAERPCMTNDILSGISVKTFSSIRNELARRMKFNGEYSIFSTINSPKGDTAQVYKELMLNFTATEVTLPHDLNEIRESDIHLNSLKKVLTDDIWLQVVNYRQYQPGFTAGLDIEFNKMIDLLNSDLDVKLTDYQKDSASRQFLVQSMLHPLGFHMRKIAQSLARADEKKELESRYFKDARNIIIDNFDGFINNPGVNLKIIKMDVKKENSRYSIIQTQLINNPYSTVNLLYADLKSTGYYKDLDDLQQLLDWMRKKGQVIVDRENRYRYVGPPP